MVFFLGICCTEDDQDALESDSKCIAPDKNCDEEIQNPEHDEHSSNKLKKVGK